MNPLEIGSKSQFAALRSFLREAGYTEARICEKLGLPAEGLDIVTLADNKVTCPPKPGPLDLLSRLFLLGEFVSIADAENQFHGPAWAAVNALGLIEEDSTDRARCFGSVALYPMGDLFIVSDRWSNPDRSPKQSFSDIVYPALTHSTREFLHFLPQAPCEVFLELCAGSGIAALIASRQARKTIAADITERSTHFANFNAALNGIENVTAVQGDLYQPVQGQVFDRIAAHPPYMPVLQRAEIYYDGGEDGEQLTRRILEGLHQHLAPGGRLYCRTLGTDREGSTFDQRLRQWLGAAEAEFDIALFVSKNLEPSRFAMDSAVRRSTGQAEVNQWKALFGKLGVKEIVTGTVVVQRRTTRRPVFTIRRSLSSQATSAAIESVLRWETACLTPGLREASFAAKPIASPRVQLLVRHAMRDGDFVPQDFSLFCDYPFFMDCKVQPWMAQLLSFCDGSRSIHDLYAECKASGWIVPETPPREFLGLIGSFVSGGFLRVEEITTPAAAG